MVSYLHPKSRSTSTLFTTTLAVSFLVVSLPHILPCPVDTRRYADSATVLDKDGNPIKKRRTAAFQKDVQAGLTIDAKEQVPDELPTHKPQRECPVPKPTGIVGRLFGLQSVARERPVEVVVQPMIRKAQQDGGDKVP